MIKKLCSLFLAFCLLVGFLPTNAIAAESNQWQYMTPMQSGRMSTAIGYWNDKIYVVGGTNDQFSAQLLLVDIYDPQTDTWSLGTGMSSYPYTGAGSAVVGRYIYFFGGENPNTTERPATNTMVVYDMEEDTWYTGPSMPTARAVPAVAAVGNEIYVAGGQTYHYVQWGTSTNEYLNVVEIYNTETNTWRIGTDLPAEQPNASAVYADNKLYLVGGQKLGLGGYSQLLIFDLTTNQWHSGARLPQYNTGVTSAIYNNQIYAIGGLGIGSTLTYSNTVYVYDTATDQWEQIASLNAGRFRASSTIIDGVLYVCGGYDGSNYLNTIETLILPPIEPPVTPPEPSTRELTALLFTGETAKMAVTGADASSLHWYSTDDSIATVSSTGMVTAIDEGFAYIYAEDTAMDFSAYIPVEVLTGSSGGNETSQRLTVSIPTGDPVRLRLLGAGTTPVTWTSFDPDIATVDQNGVVTATGSGLVIIQAECGGETYYLYVKA